MNPGIPSSFEDELRELRQRIQRLEEALARHKILDDRWLGEKQHGVNSPQPVVSQPVPPSGPIPLPSAPQVESNAAPPSLPNLQVEPQPERSLESRIGSQWFNRIGILAVLIGMACFLKLAIDNHWIGPLGRVLIGLLAGAALIVWSERFRARGYAAFSYSLKSIGSGTLYLSLWAAFSLYQLIPGSVAFVAMIAITAFNGYLSWVQDAELLAVYAIAGGFSTPMLVSTGENHEVALFSYMLLLDVAVLLLVALRPWSRLLFGAFVGTIFYVAGWAFSFYTHQQAAPTAFFIACFFLVFALAPRLIRLADFDEEIDPARYTSAWDKLATILLPILNAALGFMAFYQLLESTGAKWAQPWLAVLFAAFYLLLMRLPARGRWRSSPFLLSDLHLAAAVVFLTIAIPLQASGRWITVGWLAEGAALLWVASRTRSVLVRALAILCLALALVALVTLNPDASLRPFINQRFATWLCAITAFACVAFIASRALPEENRDPILQWPNIAAAAALLLNVLILAAISLEIHAYWWNHRWQGNLEDYNEYKMYAQFTYSAFFMAFGAILLALGFSRHSAFLRWQALILLAISIGKVFLVDVSELSQGYRILSFLGLGALLLGVSFVYQRDWFHLREHGGHAS
ncbi:MAG TPA: DUF2339 domain-containing protein [Terracidiphilus sp.]|jgi:uncharacterized membrane protein